MVKKMILAVVHGVFLSTIVCYGACDQDSAYDQEQSADDDGTKRALSMAAEMIASMHDLTVSFEQAPRQGLLRREQQVSVPKKPDHAGVYSQNSCACPGCLLLREDTDEQSVKKDFAQQVIDLVGKAKEVQLNGRTCYVLSAVNKTHLDLAAQELAHHVRMLKKQGDDSERHAAKSLGIAKKLLKKNDALQQQLQASNTALQGTVNESLKNEQEYEELSSQLAQSAQERSRVEQLLWQVIEERDSFQNERDKYAGLLSGVMRACVMQRREIKKYQGQAQVEAYALAEMREQQLPQQQECEGEQYDARESEGDSGEDEFCVVTNEQQAGE